MAITTIVAGQWTAKQMTTAQNLWDAAAASVQGYDGGAGPGLVWNNYTAYVNVQSGQPVFAIATTPHVATFVEEGTGVIVNGTDEMAAYLGPAPSVPGNQIVAVVQASYRAWLTDVKAVRPLAVCWGIIPKKWSPTLYSYYRGTMNRCSQISLSSDRWLLYGNVADLLAAS